MNKKRTEPKQEKTIQLNKIIQSQDELIYKVGQTLLDLGKLCMLNNSANLLLGMKGDDDLDEHVENLMQKKKHYEEKLKKAQEDYINGILSDEEYTDIAADLKRKIDENVYEMKMYKDKQDEMAGIYRIACENYQDDEDIIGDDMMAEDEMSQELREIKRALDKIYEVLTKPKGSDKVIYLAAPYSGMEELSFEVSCMVAAFLMKTGKIVYSPVVYGHTLASKYDLPTDNEFWLTQDLDMLCRCDELYVITLKGWDKSSGVAAEIDEALMMGMPVSFIDPKPFIENIMEGDRHDR